MPHYLFQATYTAEAWAALVKKPQDRRAVVEAAIKKLGGTLESAWLSFGEYDVACICRLPDNTSAAAFAIAAAAGGALQTSKTTPLLTFDEGLEAMRKAGQTGYRPPK